MLDSLGQVEISLASANQEGAPWRRSSGILKLGPDESVGMLYPRVNESAALCDHSLPVDPENRLASERMTDDSIRRGWPQPSPSFVRAEAPSEVRSPSQRQIQAGRGQPQRRPS